MPREIKGIILSRILILVSIVAVPVIIFLVFIFTDFHVWWTDDVALTVFLANFLAPLTFSISWFYFLVLFATRFSIAIDSMEKTINIIPLRLKIFYGINAMLILFIWVFPLITPIVSVLSFASLAWQLSTIRKKNWDEKSRAPIITYPLMILAAILPIFCTFNIALDYLKLPLYLWEVVWIPLLDQIYAFSYCLGTSLAIGSLFIMFNNKGVSEYEQFLSDAKQKISLVYIGIFEAFLFGFFLILYYLDLPVLKLFYNIGFIIIVLVSIVNYFSGKNQSKKFTSHIIGYILAAIFMGSHLFLEYSPELSDLMRNASLAILAAIFIIVFFYTFITIEE